LPDGRFLGSWHLRLVLLVPFTAFVEEPHSWKRHGSDQIDLNSLEFLTLGSNGYVFYATIDTKNRVDMDLFPCFAFDLDIVARSFPAKRCAGGLGTSGQSAGEDCLRKEW
jgi:hypothetical protein